MPVSVFTLREALDYDPKTGLFRWRERPIHHFKNGEKWRAADNMKRWNTVHAGKPALTQMNQGGYLYGGVDGENLLAHRVAWEITHLKRATTTIDHSNGMRSDNRIVNLRPASRSQQARNCASAKGSTSKYLGVSWRKDRSCWRSVIFDGVKQEHLGSFRSEEDAARAYDRRAKVLHGEFARLNFPDERVA